MAEAVIITGLGHMHPEHKISNAFFANLDIDSAPEWVEERTGIVHRHSILEPQDLIALRHGATSYLALKEQGKILGLGAMSRSCWEMAMQRHSHASPGGLPDLAICGTSVPDMDIPANASLIAKELDLSCTAFDVNSACSSFVTGVAVASSLVAQGSFQRAAVFNPERYSTRLDYSDRRSCILFGDGASCAILERYTPGRSGLKVLGSFMRSDPSGCDAVTIPIPGFFAQNGARVQKFAITKTCEVTNTLLTEHRLKATDINYFIGHQANLRMLQSAATRLGFTAEQHLFNVDRFGNQGAAGAPCVLSENWPRFQVGDYIIVSVVGAGLTWGSLLLQKV